MKQYIYILFIAIAVVSCGSKKNLEGNSGTSGSELLNAEDIDRITYVKKVNANAANTENIVSKIDFSLSALGKDITLDGKLAMRRNTVIRITVQVPLLGMEAARLEFTPQQVLLIDRINKEYVKATYNDLEFLKANGLDFYALQALFWNELFLPGTQQVNEDNMNRFDVSKAVGTNRFVNAKNGKLDFQWTTNADNGRIDALDVKYATAATEATSASWTYKSFSALNNKQFPTVNALSFSSKALKNGAKINVGIRLKKLTTDSQWDAITSPSSKYSQVSAEELIGKLIKM